jgi:succinate dehydrogenase flavin-adding protein (antitoxin of CptAB toxin-antitoxin module)
MKELDLLLMRYFAEHWPAAEAAERAAFEALLELPDPVLVDYLYGRAEPPDADMQRLVTRLRAIRPAAAS